MPDDISFDEEIKKDFLDEVSYFLDECEGSYLRLEDPACRVVELANIFRAVHSIKGTGAAVGFADLSAFAHVVEDCLSLLRNRPDLVDTAAISILLKSGDELKSRISSLKAKDSSLWLVEDFKNEVRELSKRIAVLAAESSRELVGPWVEKMPDSREHLTSAVVPTSGTVKVDAQLVEVLSNIAVDLMVLRKQFSTHCKAYSSDETLMSLVTLLDKNIDLIYDKAVHLRKLPVSTLFLKTQRVIRDLSIKLGKPVDVRVSGEGIEIDRVIVDLLADPLMHITRNSLDHGIESAQIRQQRGKPEKGTIQLEAYQSGGKVVVKVIDDGNGISRERIIAKAIERGLVPAGTDPHLLNDAAVFDFLFAPGFSTADEVTDVSGRGVGMDVVKTNLAKIKGLIDIETSVGSGTTITISIPISTAITDGMIFKIESEFYILPTEALVQIVDVVATHIIKFPTGQEAINFRDQVVPLFRLENLFRDQMTERSGDVSSFQAGSAISESMRVVLFDTTKQIVAIRIDQVIGKTKAIIRPLGGDMEGAPGISGASLLGSGQLALVLDPFGLEQIFSDVREAQVQLESAA